MLGREVPLTLLHLHQETFMLCVKVCSTLVFAGGSETDTCDDRKRKRRSDCVSLAVCVCVCARVCVCVCVFVSEREREIKRQGAPE